MFETTPWSIVLAAGGQASLDEGRQRVALEQLCALYWLPLHSYIRRKVGNRELAEDLTQSFFQRLLSGRTLQLADPARGRFRTFLLQSFEWHLANEFRECRAEKRGGRVRFLPVDLASLPDRRPESCQLTPDQLYEREWALTILQLTFDRLRDEQLLESRGLQFEVLKPFLAGNPPVNGYATAAAQLGMTEPAARMAVSRLRTRFRELLQAQIRSTLSSADDFDEEFHALFRALTAGGR